MGESRLQLTAAGLISVNTENTEQLQSSPRRPERDALDKWWPNVNDENADDLFCYVTKRQFLLLLTFTKLLT